MYPFQEDMVNGLYGGDYYGNHNQNGYPLGFTPPFANFGGGRGFGNGTDLNGALGTPPTSFPLPPAPLPPPTYPPNQSPPPNTAQVPFQENMTYQAPNSGGETAQVPFQENMTYQIPNNEPATTETPEQPATDMYTGQKRPTIEEYQKQQWNEGWKQQQAPQIGYIPNQNPTW